MSADRYKIEDQKATYFVTPTIIKWVDIFTRDELRSVIIDSLKFNIKNSGLVLNGWVIMSNHIHLLGRVESEKGMSGFLRDFKKYTSRQLTERIKVINESRREWILDLFSFEAKRSRRTKEFKVWQDGNHALDLSNYNIDAVEKLDYIHMNPVKAGWVNEPDHFKYSSAMDYYGKRGLLEIELI